MTLNHISGLWIAVSKSWKLLEGAAMVALAIVVRMFVDSFVNRMCSGLRETSRKWAESAPLLQTKTLVV